MGRRRHWYHCSSRNHGPEFTAIRRPPLHASCKEPPVPRLCVCRSIAGCFAAAIFDDEQPVYVYKTERPRRAVRPRGVWDQIVTQEMWLVPPVRMVLVAIINGLTVRLAQGDVRNYHQRTGLRSDLWVRIAQFSIAVEVLRAPHVDVDWAARCRKIASIDDPRGYLLDQTLNQIAKQRRKR